MIWLLHLFLWFIFIKILIYFFSWAYGIIYLYIIPKNFNPLKYGKWAIITGGTSGIGLEIAKKLASYKLNIVIIGNDKDGLENTKKQLQSVYKIQTITIFKDFSDDNYSTIEKELKELDIGILINNVGIITPFGQSFIETDSKKLQNVLSINVLSTVMMIKIVLPKMIQKKSGIIINFGSASSYNPLPFTGIYPSSKKFIDMLTKCLINEFPFKDYGIYFSCIHPMYVSTPMTNLKPSFTVPTVEEFVESAIQAFENNGACSGYLIHEIILSIMSILPGTIVQRYTIKYWNNVRKRYLQRIKNE